MSEKELDAILEELRNGKSSDNNFNQENDVSLKDALKGFGATDVKEIKDEKPLEPLAPPKKSITENEPDLDIVESFSKEKAPKQAPKKSKQAKKNDKKKKIIIISIIAVVLVIAITVVAIIAAKGKKAEEPTKPTQPKTTQAEVVEVEKGPLNPLTGETGYSEAALTQRPVAIVVENEYSSESVRPQWALADADIVLEGESEYSTRMLLFWADYTKVPSKVGPTRSARPPFIRFSQLFDSIFIHAGLSKTKGDYIGADTVFKTDNVDHINLLSYEENGTYFGRDRSRGGAVEHTGYLNGDNLPALIERNKINTSLNKNKFTTLSFNDEAKALSSNAGNSALFRWSTTACPKKGHFTYDSASHKYTTTDFDSSNGKANPAWENLVFLLDQTEYIVKHGYKGGSETYCNYKLSGGKGMIFSEGTYIDISWGVSNGKLWMKDANGNEVKLNAGKTYIGYGSSNHGGSITPNPEA